MIVIFASEDSMKDWRDLIRIADDVAFMLDPTQREQHDAYRDYYSERTLFRLSTLSAFFPKFNTQDVFDRVGP